MQNERTQCAEDATLTAPDIDSQVKHAPQLLTRADSNMDILMDVNLPLRLSLGKTRLLLKDVLEIVPGSEIQLEKNGPHSVEIIVNGSVIGWGEVMTVDGCYAVKIQKMGKVL